MNFLTDLPAKVPIEQWETIAGRLLLALAVGFGVLGVYRLARRDDPRNGSFEVTLVLLAILIAMVTRVIGDSVARAFSLVGALSIVRFRTVVRDTQDTAYVIFAVVVGMAVGANLLPVALIGMAVIAIAALLLRKREHAGSVPMEQNLTLNLRVPIGSVLEQLSAGVFDRHLQMHQLAAVATAKQGTMLEASYSVRLREGVSAVDFVQDLNKVEGVQGVELLSPGATSER